MPDRGFSFGAYGIFLHPTPSIMLTSCQSLYRVFISFVVRWSKLSLILQA